MNPLTQRLLGVLSVADMLGSNDTQLGDAIELVAVLIDAHESDDLVAMANAVIAGITFNVLKYNHPAAILLLDDVLQAIDDFECEVSS